MVFLDFIKLFEVSFIALVEGYWDNFYFSCFVLDFKVREKFNEVWIVSAFFGIVVTHSEGNIKVVLCQIERIVLFYIDRVS